MFEGVQVKSPEAPYPLLTVAALVLTVGAASFCAVQALLAPRRTFCAQRMHDD